MIQICYPFNKIFLFKLLKFKFEFPRVTVTVVFTYPLSYARELQFLCVLTNTYFL